MSTKYEGDREALFRRDRFARLSGPIALLVSKSRGNL